MKQPSICDQALVVRENCYSPKLRCLGIILSSLLFVSLTASPTESAIVEGLRVTPGGIPVKNADLLKDQMDLLIDELDRACDLTAAQKKKLEVAAKGAIQKVIEQAKPNANRPGGLNAAGGIPNERAQEAAMVAMQKKIAAAEAEMIERKQKLEAAKAAAKAEVDRQKAKFLRAKFDELQADVERIDRDIKNDRARVLRETVALHRGVVLGTPPASPASTKIWKTTVEKTLTNEQQRTIEAERDQRFEFERNRHINDITIAIDRTLQFTAKQRDGIRQLLDDTTKNAKDGHEIIGTWIQGHENIERVAPQLPDAKLRKLLSKPQLKKWVNFNPSKRNYFYGRTSRVVHTLADDGAFTIEKQFRIHREVVLKGQMEAEMGFQIDRLDRFCNLSDDQKSKLIVAAKGAVQRIAQRLEAVEQVEKAQLAGNLRQVRKAKLVEDRGGLLVDKVAKRLFPAEGQRLKIPASKSADSAMKEKLWTDAVDRILMDEQKRKLKESEDQRVSFIRSSIPRHQVSLMDEPLKLTNDQRLRLVKLVQAAIVDADRVIVGNLATAISQLDAEKVKTILSDIQMKEWKRQARGDRTISTMLRR